MHEFQDIIKWLFLLYSTTDVITDEDLKGLNSTSLLVYNLINKVDYEENRLRKEREEIEGKLRKKRDDFTQSIDEMTFRIDSLKTAYTSLF